MILSKRALLIVFIPQNGPVGGGCHAGRTVRREPGRVDSPQDWALRRRNARGRNVEVLRGSGVARAAKEGAALTVGLIAHTREAEDSVTGKPECDRRRQFGPGAKVGGMKARLP